MAPFIIVAGIALVFVGVAAWLGWLNWFGRLPGDIRIEGERGRLFAPITSMILLSILATLLLNLARRLF